MAQGRMPSGIIPVFYQINPLKPFCRARIDKTPQKCFKTLVDAFRLSIGLRMIRSGHFQFNSSQAKEVLRKLTCEYLISVRNNGSGQTMKVVNLLEEQLGH
jgi:hypothetical protein